MRSWLAEDDPTNQRRDEVRRVHDRVQIHGTHNDGDSGLAHARQKRSGRVKEATAPGVVDGGADQLQDILRGIKRRGFTRILAQTEVVDGGGVFSRGNGLGDHVHPMPRWFHKRSKASTGTFATDKPFDWSSLSFW